MKDVSSSEYNSIECVDVNDSDGDVSSVLSDLKLVCPEANIYTGRIESSFLYKRRYKSSGDHSVDIDTSFWWLTIKTLDGISISYNVSSENERVDTLKKGDLVTFIITTPISLSHSFKIRSDKKIVTNNSLATTVLFHREVDGFYIIEPSIKPVKITGSTGQSFFVALVMFVLDIYFLDNDSIVLNIVKFIGMRGDNSIWGLVGLFLCIWCVFNLVIDSYYKSIFKKSLGLYYALKSASENILAFYFNYNVENSQLRSHSEGAIGSGPIEEIDQELINNTSSEISVREISKKFDQLNSEWSDPFIYRHVLSPNDKGRAQSKTYLAKVTNKDISVSAKESKRSYTRKTTTTYKNRMYGYMERKEHEYRDFSHISRSSIISGSVEVCTAEHDSLEVSVPTDALRSMDIGDWLLIGVTYAQIDDEYETNELTYNISKNIKTDGSSISNFGEVSDVSTILVAVVFIGFWVAGFQTNIPNSDLVKMFSLFMALIMLFSAIAYLRNKLAVLKLLKRFKYVYKACLKNRTDILIAAE